MELHLGQHRGKDPHEPFAVDDAAVARLVGEEPADPSAKSGNRPRVSVPSVVVAQSGMSPTIDRRRNRVAEPSAKLSTS